MSGEPPPAPQTAELLDELEARRAEVFFRSVSVLTLLVLACLPILPGPVWLRAMTAACCLLATVACLFLLSRAKRQRYTPELATSAALFLTPLAIGIIYYLGLYSASATLLTVGIYFFGSSQSRRVAWSAYLACAILYFLTTLAIALGLLPDLAVFSVDHVPRASRFYRVVMQQAIFGMTFYLARSSRRATEVVLERAQHADRLLQRTEAQLLEAKGELDRALRPGEGRLSGQTIEGYELGALLGRGGMGEVYACIHRQSGRTFAIKLLHPNVLDNPDNVARFMREARATAALPSEHVAAVIDVGRTGAGIPFIVMELLVGHDLAWYLRKTPQLALDDVVQIVEHTAYALSAVRDAGIVHRDLKPGNLFLTDALPRRWKVLDFGLSKVQDGQALTKDQAIGTPSYMAPEQIRGLEVDHQADLYALSAIAYRALTGRPPFVGDEIAHILMDVLSKVPEAPGDFVKVPVDVELVLAIGLAKKKKHRFQCVEDLAGALCLAAAGELDDQTRARGWAVLKKYPWGSHEHVRL